MSPDDLLTHTRLVHNNTGRLLPETAVLVTVAFPPGSCSITAYKVTSSGYHWGKENKEISNEALQKFGSNLYEKVQLWVSQKFMGFFMVPDSGIWNYNFIGLSLKPNSPPSYTLGCPKGFYAEEHRPSHFLTFNKQDEEGLEGVNDDELDVFN